MKKSMITLSGLALTLVGAAAFAQSGRMPGPNMAQQDNYGTMPWQGPGGAGMMGPGMMGPGMMDRGMARMMMLMMDTDGDGALSMEEMQAVHQRMFAYADADKNGKLTADELGAGMQGPQVEGTE